MSRRQDGGLVRPGGLGIVNAWSMISTTQARLATAVYHVDATAFCRLASARLLRSPHAEALVLGSGALKVTLHQRPGNAHMT